MASTSTLFMAVPVTSTAHSKPTVVSSDAFFQPLQLTPKAGRLSTSRRVEVRASGSMKEKTITGLTAVALAAALIVPDIAEAAQPGVSPSLKNFLLSIVSGGSVLVAILGAVVGVANFDPVKRS